MRDGSLSRPGWYGVVFLILFSPLIQGGSPRLPTTVVEVAILLLVALWGYEWCWRAPVQTLRVTLLDGCLGFFLFLALFSFLFAPYQHSAEKGMLLIFCYSALYWWLVSHPGIRGLEAVSAAVLLQGIFQAALVTWQWWGGDLLRPAGTFYNPNFTACYLAAAAALAAGRAVYPHPSGGGKGRQALFAVVSLLMGAAVVLTGSRGGVLALGAGMGVLLLGRGYRLALGAVGAAAAALVILPNPWLARILEGATTDVFAYSRIAIWKSALTMTADHPWLGTGLGQFGYVSPRYAFPVEAHWAQYSRLAETAHSEYLHAGAEMGLPGLILWVCIVILLAAFTLRSLRERTPARRGVLMASAAALAAVAVHAAVDFPLHVPPVAILAVFLAASLRLHGVEGPGWLLDLRLRKSYGLFLVLVLAVLGALAVRPLGGFWYFLGGLGAPRNLLQEKWSLEEAPRRDMALEDSIPFFEKAIAVDPRNASYHNALGSRFFKIHLLTGDEEMRRRGLYHASFAAELNPNHFRYPYNLGQALEGLARRRGGRRGLLLEAREEYHKAISLAPRHYSLSEKAAFLDEELGNFQEAESLFREVVRLEPFYLQGWYNLGAYLARRGREGEAETAIRRGKETAVRFREGGYKIRTAYERALVDFDPELFDNFLQTLGEKKDFSLP